MTEAKTRIITLHPKYKLREFCLDDRGNILLLVWDEFVHRCILQFNPSDQTVLTVVPRLSGSGIAFSPKTGLIYVSEPHAHRILSVNRQTGTTAIVQDGLDFPTSLLCVGGERLLIYDWPRIWAILGICPEDGLNQKLSEIFPGHAGTPLLEIFSRNTTFDSEGNIFRIVKQCRCLEKVSVSGKGQIVNVYQVDLVSVICTPTGTIWTASGNQLFKVEGVATSRKDTIEGRTHALAQVWSQIPLPLLRVMSEYSVYDLI